ncbi:hypothetical protein B0H13DRAFT_2280639 [Mycena leptocephala]|nr:hypothetical protein B0H13DRAFT_2280639 [Mycena leptocephala]
MTQGRVPNELWLEICCSLPKDSFKQTLGQISLTCRSLHHLSRSLLFADFVFHPQAEMWQSLSLPQKSGFERSKRLLEFWSSDEIAPLVRSCDITPSRKDVPDFQHQNPRLLLDAMFARLPRFSGLRRIYALKVEFNQTSREPVQLAQPQTPARRAVLGRSRSHVEAFQLRVSGREGAWASRRRYPLAFDAGPAFPPRIGCRSLSEAFRPRQRQRGARGEASLSKYFPNVSKLSVGMCYKDIPANVKVLAKFPAVRTLSLESWGSRDVPEALAANILPVLAEYTGSYGTLRMVCPRATLVHLTVTICEAWELIAELKAIPLLNTVTTLDLTLYSVTNVDFNTIVAFFPQLVELRIAGGAESHPSTNKNILGALLANPAVIPPSLERLALSWANLPHWPDLRRCPPPELAKLRDTLVTQCPALVLLWFDSATFSLRWQKSKLDGTVREKLALDRVSVNSAPRKVLRSSGREGGNVSYSGSGFGLGFDGGLGLDGVTISVTVLLLQRYYTFSRLSVHPWTRNGAGQGWISHHSRAHLEAAAQRRYASAIALIVESGMLYSATVLSFLIVISFPCLSSTLEEPLLQIVTQVMGIALTLIIVRVGLGVTVEDSLSTTTTSIPLRQQGHASSRLGTSIGSADPKENLLPGFVARENDHGFGKPRYWGDAAV